MAILLTGATPELPAAKPPSAMPPETAPVPETQGPAAEPQTPPGAPPSPAAASVPKTGPNWGIPEGCVPVENRLGQKGVTVPKYAKQDPGSYYYDPKSGKYPRRIGFPMDEGAGHQIPCFPAGTLVATPDGPCGIDRIVPGQMVLAYQEHTRDVVARRVLEVHVSSADWLHRVATDTTSVLATGDHLFWIGPGEFRAARDLGPDVAPRGIDGTPHAVASVEAIYTGKQPTYKPLGRHRLHLLRRAGGAARPQRRTVRHLPRARPQDAGGRLRRTDGADAPGPPSGSPARAAPMVSCSPA
jgi:hypothetical protein